MISSIKVFIQLQRCARAARAAHASAMRAASYTQYAQCKATEIIVSLLWQLCPVTVFTQLEENACVFRALAQCMLHYINPLQSFQKHGVNSCLSAGHKLRAEYASLRNA